MISVFYFKSEFKMQRNDFRFCIRQDSIRNITGVMFYSVIGRGGDSWRKVRCFSKGQIIGYATETAAKHLLLHRNCLEEKSFALHLDVQDCQFPKPGDTCSCLTLNCPPLSRCPSSPPPNFTAWMR